MKVDLEHQVFIVLMCLHLKNTFNHHHKIHVNQKYLLNSKLESWMLTLSSKELPGSCVFSRIVVVMSLSCFLFNYRLLNTLLRLNLLIRWLSDGMASSEINVLALVLMISLEVWPFLTLLAYSELSYEINSIHLNDSRLIQNDIFKNIYF